MKNAWTDRIETLENALKGLLEYVEHSDTDYMFEHDMDGHEADLCYLCTARNALKGGEPNETH